MSAWPSAAPAASRTDRACVPMTWRQMAEPATPSSRRGHPRAAVSAPGRLQAPVARCLSRLRRATLVGGATADARDWTSDRAWTCAADVPVWRGRRVCRPAGRRGYPRVVMFAVEPLAPARRVAVRPGRRRPRPGRRGATPADLATDSPTPVRPSTPAVATALLGDCRLGLVGSLATRRRPLLRPLRVSGGAGAERQPGHRRGGSSAPRRARAAANRPPLDHRP